MVQIFFVPCLASVFFSEPQLFSGEQSWVSSPLQRLKGEKWCEIIMSRVQISGAFWQKNMQKKNTLLIFVPTAVLQGMKGRFFNTETVSAFRIAWGSFRLTFEWCSVRCYEKQMIWEERGKRIWELFLGKKWGELIRDPERGTISRSC